MIIQIPPLCAICKGHAGPGAQGAPSSNRLVGAGISQLTAGRHEAEHPAIYPGSGVYFLLCVKGKESWTMWHPSAASRHLHVRTVVRTRSNEIGVTTKRGRARSATSASSYSASAGVRTASNTRSGDLKKWSFRIGAAPRCQIETCRRTYSRTMRRPHQSLQSHREAQRRC